MKPFLLLVDLQSDFLSAAGLEPPASEVIRGAARLLSGARALSVPVAHAITTVEPSGENRMPHWKARGKWLCVRGTPGHAAPAALWPWEGEAVVSKTFFSAFAGPALDRALAAAAADTLLVAGVHLHGCVRATVLDAYQRGLAVWVAEDAVGSDDPLHAAVTRRYLEERAAWFAPAAELLRRLAGAPTAQAPVLPAARVAGREVFAASSDPAVHRSPRDPRQALFSVCDAGPAEVEAAVVAARSSQADWEGVAASQRCAPLGRLADRLEAGAEGLARDLAIDVGKPVAEGRAEVLRSADLLRGVCRVARDFSRERCSPTSSWRRLPRGVVAAVTPWNNPIAIPLGKIAPALALGNAVVWKPALPASRIALRILDLAREAGVPDGLVNLVAGGRGPAAALAAAPGVDAVSLSGSSLAGWSAQEICARRRIPLQAELGGNNAAIVWDGADLARAVEAVVRGAFSFAGQRCTANRRVIVGGGAQEPFLRELATATQRLVWGDPLESDTDVGPMVSEEARARVAEAIGRAAAGGARVLTPHGAPRPAGPAAETGAYFPPTIVLGASPESEIVQEETFGPVLVVQAARDFEAALDLANGVRQGLVAALFAGPGPERERFLAGAQAGLLKWNRSTAGADGAAPFGGWKASGLGPPERGPGDLEFFTRVQTLEEGE
jgi:acyl-CoA reductase-like NAD-dependent aldehyde dehydrogenase/nicotinamidase-related amidase